MVNLNEWFTVHPRKRVDRTPLTDWAGRPMPKTLSDVYGSYSSKKAAAYEYCRMLCDKFNGERFCIASHNNNVFTVDFDFPHPETGEMMHAHITPSCNHAYYIG